MALPVTATRTLAWSPRAPAVLAGALGGLVAGIVIGIPMSVAGFIERNAASLVGSDSLAVGWLVHLFAATAVGALYGALVHVRSLDQGAGYGAVAGLLVGVVLTWFALDLVLGLPLSPLHREAVGPLSVPINLARVVLHVVYGVILGVITAWLADRFEHGGARRAARGRPA